MSISPIWRGFTKRFRRSSGKRYDGAPSQADLVSMRVPSEGRSVDYKWLGDFPMMQEWLGDRVIKDLSAFHYEITNKDFESTVEVDQQRHRGRPDRGLHSDDPGACPIGPAAPGPARVRTLLKLGFRRRRCFDGQYFFDDDHPIDKEEGTIASNTGGGIGLAVVFTGPVEALETDHPSGSEAARVRGPGPARRRGRFHAQEIPLRRGRPEERGLRALAARVRIQGDPGRGRLCDGPVDHDGVQERSKAFRSASLPTHMIVPPTLESAGRMILKMDRDDAGAANVWYNTAELLSSWWFPGWLNYLITTYFL